jgi:hypothetical protein
MIAIRADEADVVGGWLFERPDREALTFADWNELQGMGRLRLRLPLKEPGVQSG